MFICFVLQLEFHNQSIYTLVCVACKHHGSFSVANMPEEGNNFDQLNIIDVWKEYYFKFEKLMSLQI